MKTRLLMICSIIVMAMIAACNGESGSTDSDDNTDGSGDSMETTGEGVYSAESGKVVYQLTGATTGSETLYWADFGNKQRKETNTKLEMMGMVQEQNIITITSLDTIFTLDPVNMTGTRMVNNLMAGMSAEERKAAGYKVLESMGGKKTGTENFLGKECDVWEVDSVTVVRTLIWEGLNVMTSMEMLGMIQNIQAVSIDTDASVSDELFETTGYTIEDQGSVGDMLNY